MHGRAFALTVLCVGALVSFVLAIWSAWQGRTPYVETAHAVLFAFMAMLLVTRDPVGGKTCSECGHAFEAGMAFCASCGRYPRVARPSA